MTTCAIVSFRLRLTDGVSVVADTWADALERLGFEVVTVAGEGPVDRPVAGLRIGATEAPAFSELEESLRDADLVVVENLCTIPLNLPASRVLVELLRGRPAILHHHDPAWQRPELAHVIELPARDPAWRHVTINHLTEAEMADRGIQAVTIYNAFDTHPCPGDRASTRSLLEVGPDELLAGHPVRAVRRKNVPVALEICQRLGATYWLLGDAEEGYGPELERLLRRARCRVIRHPLPHGPDIYAAPDLVVFPSTWEGFGNPPIEASIQRRPVAVGSYPVASELRSLGFRWFDCDEEGTTRLSSWLREPDDDVLDVNQNLAREHFSLDLLDERLRALLDDAGWLP